MKIKRWRRSAEISVTFLHKLMSGSKAPDFDAYGLLRATHSHNPTQYSHKTILTLR